MDSKFEAQMSSQEGVQGLFETITALTIALGLQLDRAKVLDRRELAASLRDAAKALGQMGQGPVGQEMVLYLAGLLEGNPNPPRPRLNVVPRP